MHADFFFLNDINCVPIGYLSTVSTYTNLKSITMIFLSFSLMTVIDFLKKLVSKY